VKEFLGALEPKTALEMESQEDKVIQETLGRLPAGRLEELGLDLKDLLPAKEAGQVEGTWASAEGGRDSC
jgi:hypothetical protein